MQSDQRILIGGGVAYDLALGYVPDKITGFTYNSTPDSIVYFEWQGPLSVANAVIIAGGGIYGWSKDGAVIAELTVDTGFTPLDSDKTPRVQVESPKPGGGLVNVACEDYTAARATAATARTATLPGTCNRPTTHNGFVYECTTAGTGSAEPDPWGTVIGGVTNDNSSVYWTCRKEQTVNAGVFGVTLGATLMTDSNTVVLVATKFDRSKDLGDIG